MGVPIFITRIKVGRGRDMVLISAESPAGDTAKGEVESLETVRMVMSPKTFAEVTHLFVKTLGSIEADQLREHAAPHPAHSSTLDDQRDMETFSVAGVSSRKH